MIQRIEYAMIGFGCIAESRIALEGFACDRKRFEPSAHSVLIGATDQNPVRREAVEKLGLKWYGDLQSLLVDPSVQAVFIATNNQSHARIATLALEAGKHVIVEKPIATTLADAEALIELAGRRRLSLMVDHMMMQNALNRKARQLVADGALGEINDSCFHMEFSYGANSQEAATWRCARPQELGGPIGDVASHCLYMAQFIFDSPVTALACVYYPKLMQTAVEDGAYLKFKLASGMSGSVRVAFSEPRGGMQSTLDNLGYEIFGTQGILRGHGTLFQLSGHPGEPIPVRLILDTFNHQQSIRVDEVTNIYQQVIEQHAQSIIDAKPMDGRDGLQNLQLIQAAHASARQHGALIRIHV